MQVNYGKIFETIESTDPKEFNKIFTPEFLAQQGILEFVAEAPIDHSRPDWFQWGVNCGLNGWDLERCIKAGIVREKCEFGSAGTPEPAMTSFKIGLQAGNDKKGLMDGNV